MALATPVVASAQTAVGVRAGMRWSELDAGQDAGSISSLVLGGYFGFGITSRLAVQIEAVHGKRGAESLRVGDSTLDDDAAPARVEMSYLDVPILLRAGFPGERFLPSVYVGPYVGFLLGCELEPEDGDARQCDQANAAQRFRPRNTELGMVLGAGLDMAMGESTIFIDGRYSLGLLPIQAGDQAFDARHGGLAVSAGVAVPVGR